MLRTVPRLLLVLFATVGVARAADDFAAHYGYPDAEKFLVRREITLTAKYGENHAACEMLIEPRNSRQLQSTKEQSMATATVSKIIDELIPPWQRGIFLNNLIESMGAAEYQVFVYQNVTIGRLFVRYLPANQDETSATIIRKDRVCRSSTILEEYVPRIELTASDLHVRYGDPVSQRFKIRREVTLTVAYGQDQSACQISVGPKRSIIPRDEPTRYLRSEVVSDIVNEVLPDANRGDLLLRTVTKSGCNELETMDYQNATVSRSRHNCNLPTPEIEGIATIRLKNPSCGNGVQ